MIIFPAIDIKDGKVVRLKQGQFDKVTEYSDDPLSVAKKWVNEGASWLHIVDLDGAQTGEIKNFDLIARVAKSVKASLQVGGGIRTEADINRFLKAGVRRVILGTKVIEDRDFLKRILSHWKERIAVSMDCVGGFAAQKGWTSTTQLKALDFAKELEKSGLQVLIYTDIPRDGMLSGPDIEGLKKILDSVKISVIASGGISNIEDVKRLYALKSSGLIGAITGKAIYEGTLDLKEAINLCSQKE